MRLRCVESGHRLPQHVALSMIGRAIGSVPDVVRALAYRPDLFGRSFSRAAQDTLRGPSEWTVAERELIAAFVSRQNRCVF